MSVIAPFWILTVPLLRTSKIFQGSLCVLVKLSWLFVFNKHSVVEFIFVNYSFLFLVPLFLWIAASFCFLTNFQFASNVKFIITSRPNTSCIGMACMVVWTVDCIAKMIADRIPFQGSSGFSLELLTWIHTILLNGLLGLLEYQVGLRITCCDWLMSYSVILLNHCCYFSHEFFTLV